MSVESTANPMNDKAPPTIEAMTDSGNPHAKESGKDVPPENQAIAWCKRFYGAMDIIILVSNTGATLADQAAATGQFIFSSDEIPEKNTGEAAMAVYTSETDYSMITVTCNSGIEHITTQCGYESNGTYIAFQSVWNLFLVVLLLLKVYNSMPYSTNDLRFYLSYDRFATTKKNKYAVYGAYTLTLATLISLISFLTKAELPVQGAFTFAILNCYLFYQSLASRWPAFNSDSNTEKKEHKLTDIFPDPIWIKACEPGLTNGYGAIVSAEQLYDDLNVALQKSEYQKDNSYLKEYGDPEQLRKVLGILYELEAEDEKKQEETDKKAPTAP